MAAGFQRPAMRDGCREDPSPAGDERRLGDFRLLREIGRGGMGVVYEAQQISLGRHVALKVLPFAAVLDSRQIARFKHEAQAAAQLNHPNIVSVFAVGVERGVHYYAMQLIDGQPLDRALSELREKYAPAARQEPDRNELRGSHEGWHVPELAKGLSGCFHALRKFRDVPPRYRQEACARTVNFRSWPRGRRAVASISGR